MADRLLLQPAQIVLRHIKLAESTDPGAVEILHGTFFAPQPRQGVNGPRGWVSGSYERRLKDDGAFRLVFPNAAGEDGLLHRERFDVITRGKRTWAVGETLDTVGGGEYRPGDEWIEIYRVSQGAAVGELLFVGTPTRARLSLDAIEIAGVDALWLLRKQRTTSLSWWRAAPRDVFEHYTRAWVFHVADAFGGDTAAEAETRFTYGTSATLTADGQWEQLRAENGSVGGAAYNSAVRLRPGAVSTVAYIENQSSYTWGTTSADPNSSWRVETEIEAPHLYTTALNYVLLGLYDSGGTARAYVYVQFLADGSVQARWNLHNGTSLLWTNDREAALAPGPLPGPYQLAIEGTGRWIWFLVNGEVVGVARMPETSFTTYPRAVQFLASGGDTSSVSYVHHLTFKHTHSFLLRGSDKGDRHLPGLPPPGGLVGEYFNEVDMTESRHTAASQYHLFANPVKEPYARRLDSRAYLDSAATAGGPQKLPTGIPEEHFWSVRWTGSVYLDLELSEVYLRVSQVGFSEIRWWLGKTGPGDGILSGSSGTGGRAHLGVTKSGWYPIVIEALKWAASPWSIRLQVSTDNVSFADVQPTYLSPIGTFNHHSRFDSYRDQLEELSGDFALQFTCSPRQLESGEFPGQLIPRVRHGRDTEKIIDSEEASGIQLEVNAEEVADILSGDAQGLADPTGASQMTAEVLDYSQIPAGTHLITHEDHMPLGDIDIQTQLRTRLDSLLALRGSAWESVGVTPAGKRELLDYFPLQGALAEFAWEPGDGARIILPEVGVADAAPRQILGVQWRIVPDGLPRPSVTFRQRPRSLKDALRRLQRESLQQIRNYQTQMVTIVGTRGAQASPTPAQDGAVDTFSRVAGPADPSKIVRVWLVVDRKTDGTQWNCEVLGTNRFTFGRLGRYDITPWMRLGGAGGADGRFYARATAGGTGTGEVGYYIEMLVIV